MFGYSYTRHNGRYVVSTKRGAFAADTLKDAVAMADRAERVSRIPKLRPRVGASPRPQPRLRVVL